jgi:hypothetical protein
MPERPGVANAVAALNVRRNAAIGFGIGIALAIFLLVYLVYIPGTTQPAPLYLALGFVLAFGVGVLVTVVLVAISAYRRAQDAPELDSDDLPYRE